MDKENKMAYAEVYTILNLLEEEAFLKIPEKIIKYFEEERDLEYNKEIDINKPLEEQGLKRETLILLAILNLNYWCESEEEKKEFLEELKNNKEIKEKELNEKYNIEKIFKDRKENTENVEITEDNETKQLVEYKENFFIKILNKIKSMFRKD